MEIGGMELLLVVGIAITLSAGTGSGEEQRVCWYTSQTVGHLSVQHIETSPDYADDLDYGIGRIQGPNQTCPKRTNYCYALWKEEQNADSENGIVITIIAQGCWESSGKQDCERNSCITSRKPPKALNDTNFCCCQGNFCNGNVTQMYYPEDSQSEVDVSPTPVVKQIDKPYVLIMIVLIVLFLVMAFCSSAFIILSRRLQKQKKEAGDRFHQDSLRLMENGTAHNSNFNAENLKLEQVIGQGRYGVVWKGSVGNQDVAVKIFPTHHRNFFYNELDIYCVPFMAHPSLLSYFGYDERVNCEGNTEYLLFLSYVPNGTLQEYLTSNVVDWNTFCKMSLSVAKGIAYLHSDIRKGDKFKPCISHRDLNTKNILVKEDLSCAICDLGFATKISGSKYYYNGEEQHAEVKSINDVGTLRYMSPEVLEGAVNLRDCETSLKQIDVYALGLILWEIASRCNDFYPPGVECAPYKLPFEAEIGHPNFEQMQILICKHKARPLFPDLWRDSPAIRSVKETIEDCWDQDAEARLTALCVEERLHELCGISERQRVSLYPLGISPTTRSSLIQKDSQNVLVVADNKEESCMSESTVDTLLAITPANPNPKNSNQFQGISTTVQPYQGRNPCLERNLMMTRDFDSNSSELIDKSHKGIISNCMDSSSIVYDFLNVYPTNSPNQNFQNPLYNGYSNQSEPVMRPHAPIPFLQNVNVESTTPKQSNMPRTSSQSRKISWKNFKRFFESKQKAEDTSPQIDFNVKSNLLVNGNYANLSTPTVPIEPKHDMEVLLSKGKFQTKIAKEDGTSLNPAADSEPTGNSLGAQNNKRPNTLPLIKSTELSQSCPVNTNNNNSNNNNNNNVRNIDKILRNLERYDNVQKNSDRKRHSLSTSPDKHKLRTSKAKSVGSTEESEILQLEAKTEETFNCDLKTLNSQKTAVGSKRDSSCGEAAGEEEGVDEAKALLLNGGGEGRPLKEEANAVRLKDPHKRVKTPGDLPLSIRQIRGEKNAARFSLYDDRIMSGHYDEEILSRRVSGGDAEVLNFSSYENIKFSENI